MPRSNTLVVVVMHDTWVVVDVQRDTESFICGTVYLCEADVRAHHSLVELVLPLHPEQLIGWEEALALVMPAWAKDHYPMVDKISYTFEHVAWEGVAVQWP